MKTHTDLVNDYYAAFNRRDSGTYAKLFSIDCELIAPGMRLTGIDALRAFDQAWSSAFAEGRIESLRMQESGGAVLTSNWFHGGMHFKPLQTPAGEIPPTGANFQAPYSASFEFDGDRIKRQRVTFDVENLPALLGVVAPPRTLSNRDVVMGIYEAFGRGDLGGALAHLATDAKLHFEASPEVPWAGTRHGRDGWTKFFQTLGQHLDGLKVTMEPFAVEGDRVAAAGRYEAVVKATGRRIDSPLVHLWTLRDGLVVSCVEMTNTAAEAAATAVATTASVSTLM